MNSTTSSPPLTEVRTQTPARTNPARYLYISVSALLFVLTLLGFRQFYLHGNNNFGYELAPSVKTLLVVHGVSMTAWVILFLGQSVLIVRDNRRLHMSLGIFGTILATAIVPLGLWAAFANLRVEPDSIRRFGLSHLQFLAIQINSMLTFGAFVAFGVWNRRRPEIHRPMMLLATLAVVGAAISRIAELRALYALTIWNRLFGPYFFTAIIGILFLAVKTALTRSLDRWLAGGLAVLIVIWLLVMQIAPTAIWVRIANFLTG